MRHVRVCICSKLENIRGLYLQFLLDGNTLKSTKAGLFERMRRNGETLHLKSYLARCRFKCNFWGYHVQSHDHSHDPHHHNTTRSWPESLPPQKFNMHKNPNMLTRCMQDWHEYVEKLHPWKILISMSCHCRGGTYEKNSSNIWPTSQWCWKCLDC